MPDAVPVQVRMNSHELAQERRGLDAEADASLGLLLLLAQALVLKGFYAVHVGRFVAQVEHLLAHRSEVARGKIL